MQPESSALLGINAEKCLVTNKSRVGHPEVIQAQRPAHGSTELVAVKRLAGIPIQVAEKIVGVEGGVADEVVGAAMKSVRARFGDLRDNSSGAATVFSGKVARKNFELLDGIGIGIVYDTVVQKIVVEAAIEHKGVRIAAPPTNAELHPSGPAACVSGIVSRQHAGLQQRQI